MAVNWETYLERLGPQGLRLVIALMLDSSEVERLAGAAIAKLPATERAQQLADRLAEDEHFGSRLLEALDRISDALEPRPENWEESRLGETVAQILRSPDSDAANILHRLARTSRPPLPGAEIRAYAELIAPNLLGEDQGTRPKWTAKVASGEADRRELEQERRELESRLRKLETQIARSMDRAASLEERLGRRVEEIKHLRTEKKGEREERQRLDRENTRLKKRIDDLLERRARERTGEITSALRKLTTEQRRTTSMLDRLREREGQRRSDLRDQGRSINGLSKLVEQVVSIEEAQARTGAVAQEEILRELNTLSEGLSASNGSQVTSSGRRGATEEDLPRVGVFVDVQNMFYGARKKDARLDFEALLETASSSRQLVRAVAYLVETREIDQSAFIHLLQMKAYEVKRKPLRIRQDKSAKGNWDLEMALDALTSSDHLDVVVLVTGDGDFVPLVRDLKLKGVRVEVYGFTASSAPDLRQAADKFINITRRLLRPLKKKRPKANNQPGP